MKKMLGFLLALTLVFSVFVGFGVAAEATPFEMNFEDFEAEDIKKGDVWDLSETGRSFTDHASLYEYTGEGDSFAHGGTKSLQAGSASARSGVSVTYTTTALVPGTTYNVSAWSWCTAKTNGATLKIIAKDSAGTELTSVSLNDKTLNEWINLKGMITIPDDAVLYEFWFNCGGLQVTTYYDDIILTPLAIDKNELLPAVDANCESLDNWADIGDEQFGDTNHRSTLGLDNFYDEKSVVKITSKKSSNMVAYNLKNAAGSGLVSDLAYVFKFDFKTENTDYPQPTMRLIHTYSDGEGVKRTLTMRYTVDGVKYSDSYSGTSVDLCMDESHPVNAASVNTWTTFEFDFIIPGTIGEYIYETTQFCIGMTGKATSKSMYFDNMSLKKAKDSVTYTNGDGAVLTQAPIAGSTVKAYISLVPATGTALALAGKYDNGTAKQLKELEAETVSRGIVLELAETAAADNTIKTLYEGKLQCATVKTFTFSVVEGETVKAFYMDGNTLKPFMTNVTETLPAVPAEQ
ncbi:MAG: hypothetical protein E7390_03665 [Ruminococcaceae bacterium]|nr:hypothetical protein [Oscillospiraceae bacterium]